MAIARGLVSSHGVHGAGAAVAAAVPSQHWPELVVRQANQRLHTQTQQERSTKSPRRDHGLTVALQVWLPELAGVGGRARWLLGTMTNCTAASLQQPRHPQAGCHAAQSQVGPQRQVLELGSGEGGGGRLPRRRLPGDPGCVGRERGEKVRRHSSDRMAGSCCRQ